MGKLEDREARVSEAKRKSFVQAMTDTDNKKVEPEEKLIQRSYYLTEELLKAITIKTAEGDFDKSGVVREALKIYLADVIEKMK